MVTKLLLCFTLGWLFLITSLPAAFSEPAKAPAKDSRSEVTQISFTREIWRHPDPRELQKEVRANLRGEKTPPWHGDTRVYTETVIFYSDDVGESTADTIKTYNASRTVTLAYGSADPNNTIPRPQEDLAGSFRGWFSGWPTFGYLTNLLAAAKFFDGSNNYIHSYPMSPFITISAVRNGITKTVVMDALPPQGMWALQAALRGVASDMDWRQVEKTAEASGVRAK